MTLGEITISANAVAWYGAIVGTLGILIAMLSAATSIVAVRRDRVKLKLTVQPNMITASPVLGINTTGPFIIITAANVGRRPIHLTAFPWFSQHGTTQSLLIKGDWQPSSELAENKSATFLAIQDKLDLSKLKAIHVKDETGRLWSQKVAIGDKPKEGGEA